MGWVSLVWFWLGQKKELLLEKGREKKKKKQRQKGFVLHVRASRAVLARVTEGINISE